MRNTLFALFLILFTSCSENANNDFEISMERMIENFNGDVSVYIEHMESGYSYTYRSEELFPTASMIKIPILIGVYDYIEKGKLTYLEDLIYKDSLAVEGVDLLASFKNNSKIPLSELLFLMISLSDNTASLWAQDLAGGGKEINDLMMQYGFHSTRVNSRVKGREQDYKNYGWGQTTAMEMSSIVKSIYEGKLIHRAASEDMLRQLNNQYWNTEALSQIPPYVQTASKSGAVSHSRSEVVLVNAPSGDYIFCVITKNQKDQSWDSNNEGFELLRNISKATWEFFEPESPWKAPEGQEKYFK